MVRKLILITIISTVIFSSCNLSFENGERKVEKIDHPILGEWIKNGHGRELLLDFKDNGFVEGEFSGNSRIKPVVKYFIDNDTIRFLDKEGYTCKGIGTYKIYQTKYYISFDVIDDKCSGRIKTMSGFWTKPGYKMLLDELDKEITITKNPELILNRGRIYLAVGDSKNAKLDFDKYILIDSTNPKVYINRAATRFPNDLEGVIFDCNKSIALDNKDKYAFFLRGLAKYDLGYEEEGCQDFKTAIRLGFSILKRAEQQKCSEYWIENE